jgi:hypothetical protein
MASNREIIDALLAQYGERLRDAFLAAIEEIKNSVTLRVIVERLERGDINGAIEAIGLDPLAFERLELAMAEAYSAGGTAEVDSLPALRDPSGSRVVFRFGVRNTEGEAWLRQHSSTLVTRIVQDQRLAIRTALETGLSEGRNPRSTALDVVGRVDRTTNRRVGGVIGLTAPQERYVANARAQLASGDPRQLANFLGRGRRDKRSDRTILAAIKSGKPLPADDIDRIIGRYSDSLLHLRGETIARHETLLTLNKGRDDAIRQQITGGKIEAQDVTKIWRSAGDGRVRHTHKALNGKSAPMSGVFQSPSGALLRYPGDPTAPATETLMCRCQVQYRVSYIDALVRKRAA